MTLTTYAQVDSQPPTNPLQDQDFWFHTYRGAWAIFRDYKEDEIFQTLNLAHMEIRPQNVPLNRPRLGMKWLKSLSRLIASDLHGCFPEDWRASGFALIGTEFLDAKGDVYVFFFAYSPQGGWRFDQAQASQRLPFLTLNPKLVP